MRAHNAARATTVYCSDLVLVVTHSKKSIPKKDQQQKADTGIINAVHHSRNTEHDNVSALPEVPVDL